MTCTPKVLREHSTALVAYAREVRMIALAARLRAVKARTMAQAAYASSERHKVAAKAAMRRSAGLTRECERPREN
jgi:hypothetical protein